MKEIKHLYRITSLNLCYNNKITNEELIDKCTFVDINDDNARSNIIIVITFISKSTYN